MKPYVILHMGISLDGRIDWGGGADNPYYELVEQFGADADLSGSNTILKAEIPEDPQQSLGQLYEEWSRKTTKPVLVIVDSQGRIKNWEDLRQQPFWKGCISLCSEATPKTHLEYLDEIGIPHILAGQGKVDLKEALEQLNLQFGTCRVRLDCGGTLNGILLRSGLVDEISVIISPALVGGLSPRTMFAAPDLQEEKGVVQLELNHVGTIRDRYVWLRYSVQKL